MLMRTVEEKSNVKKQNKMFTFTEVFPINSPAIPRLYLYTFFMGESDREKNIHNIGKIGGKLAYRLNKFLGGHWINISNSLISDMSVKDSDIQSFIDGVNENDVSSPFASITGVAREKYWKPTSRTIADFTARSLLHEKSLSKAFEELLSHYETTVKDIRIKRVVKIKACVVNNLPALSLTLKSKLVSNSDLKSFISLKHIESPNDLLGMKVSDKNTGFEGIITNIIGKIGENGYRAKLLSLSQVDETKELINNADDDELIVMVSKRDSDYNYVLTSLYPVIREADLETPGVGMDEVKPHLYIDNTARIQLVKDISNLIKEKDIIKEHSFNSKEHSELFPSLDKDFDTSIKLSFDDGNGEFTLQSSDEVKSLILNKLRNNLHSDNQTTIEISIINAVDYPKTAQAFLSNLKEMAGYLGIDIAYGKEYRLPIISERYIKETLYRCRKSRTDVIITLLPNNINYRYIHYFKKSRKENHIVVERDMRRTADNKYINTMHNLILGLLMRTKSELFTLSSALTDVFDYILVLGVKEQKIESYQTEENNKFIMLNSILFTTKGKFVRELAKDIVISKNDDLPDYILRSLFPQNTFAYTKTLIINVGYLKAVYKKILKKWSYKIKCHFDFMHLSGANIPQIYSGTAEGYTSNTRSIFKLSDYQAIIPQSLRLTLSQSDYPLLDAEGFLKMKTDYPFRLEIGINSLTMLSFLDSCIRFW